MSAAAILIQILAVLRMLVFARVIISWINLSEDNPIRTFLENTVDPFSEPIRPYTTIGGLDLSPIVLLLGLGFAESLVRTNLL